MDDCMKLSWKHELEHTRQVHHEISKEEGCSKLSTDNEIFRNQVLRLLDSLNRRTEDLEKSNGELCLAVEALTEAALHK